MCHVHSWDHDHLRPIGGITPRFHRPFPKKTQASPHKGPPPSPQPSPQRDSVQFRVEKWESEKMGKWETYGHAIFSVRRGEHCVLLFVFSYLIPHRWIGGLKTAVIIVQVHSESFTPSISEIGEILKPLE